MSSLVTFLSRRGVRARMAALLFQRTAQRGQAIAEARSIEPASPVGADVAAAFHELGIRIDGSAEPIVPIDAVYKPFLIIIGDDVVPIGTARAVWHGLELDGTADRARAVRDALFAQIVILVEQNGWVDSTERHMPVMRLR